MTLPTNLQFTDNKVVNEFAKDRASLMFGTFWKSRSDLDFSHPLSGFSRLSDKEGGWELLVSSLVDKHIVFSRKDNNVENPFANIPAIVRFYASGRPAYQAHYSRSSLINPPDGTPSEVNYDEDGSLGDCIYAMNSIGNNGKPSSEKEITKRIASARRVRAATMCDGSQKIIALVTGKHHTPDHAQIVNSPR